MFLTGFKWKIQPELLILIFITNEWSSAVFKIQTSFVYMFPALPKMLIVVPVGYVLYSTKGGKDWCLLMLDVSQCAFGFEGKHNGSLEHNQEP